MKLPISKPGDFCQGRRNRLLCPHHRLLAVAGYRLQGHQRGEARIGTTLFHRSGCVARPRIAASAARRSAPAASWRWRSGRSRNRRTVHQPARPDPHLGADVLEDQAAPLLPDFMQQHPEAQLDIQFDDRQVDLVADRFDLALRIAKLQDSSLLRAASAACACCWSVRPPRPSASTASPPAAPA